MCAENYEKTGICEPLDLFGEAAVPPRKRGRPAAKFTDADKQLVLAELAKGTERHKIAALINCTPPTLRRHLPALAGITPRVNARKPSPPAAKGKAGRPTMKFSPEEVVILVAELTARTPVKKIAGLIGCSPVTLRRYFAGLPCWNPLGRGVKKSPKNTRQKPDDRRKPQ